MYLPELKKDFAVCYEEKEAFDPCIRPPRVRSNLSCEEDQHLFYPVRQLPALVEVLRGLSDDQQGKYSVRYIVRDDGQLLLAREGRPSALIPGHREISARCRAAGNLILSQDYLSVTAITYESGDFPLPVSSLVWPLSVLLAMDLRLTDPFSIQLMDRDASRCSTSELRLTRNEISALLPDGICEEMRAVNQGTVISTPELRKSERLRELAAIMQNVNQGVFSPDSPRRMNRASNGLEEKTGIFCPW